MVTVFEQSNVGASDGTGVGCSGGTIATLPRSSECTSGTFTAGGATNIRIASGTSQAGVMFQSKANEPNLTTWPAGDWVVRLNVTTGNGGLQWDDTYICRYNSSGVNQGTVASLTGQNKNMFSTGVHSMTITQGSDVAASATDEFYIVLIFQATSGGAYKQLGITMDESIDMPTATVSRRVFVT